MIVRIARVKVGHRQAIIKNPRQHKPTGVLPFEVSIAAKTISTILTMAAKCFAGRPIRSGGSDALFWADQEATTVAPWHVPKAQQQRKVGAAEIAIPCGRTDQLGVRFQITTK